MGLAILILGLALFIATHLLVSFRELRAGLILELGKPVYHTLFGVASVIEVGLIAWGYSLYRATEYTQIWTPPGGMRHATVGLMLIASILVAASVIPSHIKAWAKHPLIAATKTWALAHLLSNGDLGSIVLFGALLAWAVYAFVSAKNRKDVTLPVAPARWGNDVFVLIAGVALYLALGFLFHPYVIGVHVFG
jgi:uncharacterized membrane protein